MERGVFAAQTPAEGRKLEYRPGALRAGTISTRSLQKEKNEFATPDLGELPKAILRSELAAAAVEFKKGKGQLASGASVEKPKLSSRRAPGRTREPPSLGPGHSFCPRENVKKVREEALVKGPAHGKRAPSAA